jgi:signal transduction histidine kinase
VSAKEESARVAEARARAGQRVQRQRDVLRPFGVAVIAAVVVTAINAKPAPGLAGRPLGVTLALAAFAVLLALALRGPFAERRRAFQATVIAAIGAAGVALAALQPHGATGLAGGAAVWLAVARLPSTPGLALGAAVVAGLALAAALSGSSAAAVLAIVLLGALLGLAARFVQESRESQSRTEFLFAQLEDAREAELRAAALTERGRIASELHDVLAHSLSGAAIQLQGARLLAEREHASERVRAAIERGGELVRDGLANARQAVGALRGEELPSVAQLGALVESFKDDLHVNATLSVEGSARALPADASLALYRGAQEALTNVARYAPGATTTVLLHYDREHTTLTVENRLATPARGGLEGAGGGRGLLGLRERLEQIGGRLDAGPTEHGWRVELDVPA